MKKQRRANIYFKYDRSFLKKGKKNPNKQTQRSQTVGSSSDISVKLELPGHVKTVHFD